MRTLLEILNLTTTYLQQKGIQNSRRQAEDLISDVLGMPRLNLYLDFERPLSDFELEKCRRFLSRRVKGEPLQYIKGEMDFYDCKIFLNTDVLIPRQETEILVDKVAKELEKHELQNKTLWDVCCGSGCMGIALKKKFPQLEVFLSDLSPKALEVAKKNAKANEVDAHFFQGDLLEPFFGRKANFLVCNPPYIAQHEFANLEREVKDFEPYEALISGPTGLEVYSRLSKDLKGFLAKSAKVWFEIGSSQGLTVEGIFKEAGWKACKVEKDWSGQDRFFFLENE